MNFVVIVIFTSAWDSPLPSVTLPVMRPCCWPFSVAERRKNARTAPESARAVRKECIETSKVVPDGFRAGRMLILALAREPGLRCCLLYTSDAADEEDSVD